LFDSKIHGVSLLQPLDIRCRTKFVHVHEDVWKTITAPDEAVALLVVEPLDVSLTRSVTA
jgi:hypothetical protein